MLRRLAELVAATPCDRPLPVAERVSFSRRPPPSRAAEQTLATWTQAQWEAAILEAPTMESLAVRAGVSRETVRAALYRAGILGRHMRYAAVRDRPLDEREARQWAAQ